MDQKTLISNIENALHQIINQANLVDNLRSSCEYSVLNGGKRIRPRIASATYIDLSQSNHNVDKFIPLFCALELLHCSSLIHDDLPCMDNDDFRRGKPTSHKVYGEAQALLTGDVLVAVAFQSITHCKFLSESKKIFLHKELSETYIELCNGQLWDLDDEKRKQYLTQIHQKKTGRLFSASFLFGATPICEDKKILQILSELGQECGVFFQILDDYLDVVGDPTERGRPSGSDEKNNRITDVSEKALTNAKHKVYEKINLLEQAIGSEAKSIRAILIELESKTK